MAQSIKRFIPGFCSGRNLVVHEFEARVGLCADVQSLLGILSPSLSLPLPCSCSLSPKINKLKKKKERRNDATISGIFILHTPEMELWKWLILKKVCSLFSVVPSECFELSCLSMYINKQDALSDYQRLANSICFSLRLSNIMYLESPQVSSFKFMSKVPALTYALKIKRVWGAERSVSVCLLASNDFVRKGNLRVCFLKYTW